MSTAHDLMNWAQELPVLPKIAVSIVILIVSALALWFLWSASLSRPSTSVTKAVHSPSTRVTTIQTTEDQQRIFTDKSVRDLLSLFDGRLPFQADKLIEPFKGTWIKGEGVVRNIIADGVPGHSIVVLSSGGDQIECRFGALWSSDIGRLDREDTLRFVGKIGSLQNGQQLYLSNCEVVR